MYKAIVYLKEFHCMDGKYVNNFDLSFEHFDEIDLILEDYGVSADDITIIDFR